MVWSIEYERLEPSLGKSPSKGPIILGIQNNGFPGRFLVLLDWTCFPGFQTGMRIQRHGRVMLAATRMALVGLESA